MSNLKPDTNFSAAVNLRFGILSWLFEIFIGYITNQTLIIRLLKLTFRRFFIIACNFREALAEATVTVISVYYF